MNKSQKGAVVGFMWCSLSIACVAILVERVYIIESPVNFFPDFFWVLRRLAIVICVLFGLSLFYYIKNRVSDLSEAEVEFDERDKLIKNRAVLVSFVSVWVLLGALSIISWNILGGSIPAGLLAIINLSIFLIVMTIYYIAILVQYGWEAKGGSD